MFLANWFKVKLNIQGFVANANNWLMKELPCCLWTAGVLKSNPLSVWFNKTVTSAWGKSQIQRLDGVKISERLKHEWQWLFLSPTFYLNFPHFSLCSRCYRCHCPPQLDGPDCQQTRLSFLGNGYAWFPPIKPCFDSHLSLEFMTEEEDGLLLYTGPLATLLPGDTEDYMAIGKKINLDN